MLIVMVGGLWASYRGFVASSQGQILDHAALASAEVRLRSLHEASVSLLADLPIVVASIAAVGFLVLTLWRRRWAASLIVALTFAAANFTTQILKVMLERPELANGVPYYTGNSLPSGHVTFATATFAAVFLLVAPRWRSMVALIGVIFSATVGIATFLDGWHRPGDIVAAYLVVEGGRAAFIEPLWANRRVADLLEQIDLDGRNDELVEELVALSTEYGILTPYTSFLAEEDAAFATREAQVGRAMSDLQVMEQTTGAAGVGQRAARNQLAASAQAPAAPVAMDAEGKAREVETVRTVGTRAFYRRDGAWVDGRLLDADADAAEEVEQFSEAFFALARRLPAEDAVYLTFEEDALVELGGRAYWLRAPRE